MQPHEAEKHLDLLGVLTYVMGALDLLIGLVILLFMTVFTGAGVPAPLQLVGVAMGVGLLITLVLAAVFFATGYGLRNRRSWSRPAGLVLAVLSLFSFPLGTAYGIYGLWVLLQDAVATELSH